MRRWLEKYFMVTFRSICDEQASYGANMLSNSLRSCGEMFYTVKIST